MKIDLGC